MKSVILIIYDSKYLKSKNQRENLSLHVTRVVKNIKKLEERQGVPKLFSFQRNKLTPLEWAENLVWSLYSGEISYKSKIVTVWGWSFNDRHPLYWGTDIKFGYSTGKLGSISLYQWVKERDFNFGSEIDRKVTFYKQPAYWKLRKYIDMSVLDEWVYIPQMYRCDCDYGAIDDVIINEWGEEETVYKTCYACEGSGVSV